METAVHIASTKVRAKLISKHVATQKNGISNRTKVEINVIKTSQRETVTRQPYKYKSEVHKLKKQFIRTNIRLKGIASKVKKLSYKNQIKIITK